MLPQPTVVLMQHNMHGMFKDLFSFFQTKLKFKQFVVVVVVCREKIHGLEYPPGQRIIIKAINSSSSSSSNSKPEAESIFTFDCKHNY